MANSNIKILSKANFDSIISSNDVCLIDFWAEWCGPCRMLGPIIDELANDFSDKVAVCKVNIDDESELAAKFGIMTIPTVLIFKNGEMVEKSVGALPKENFVDLLNKTI